MLRDVVISRLHNILLGVVYFDLMKGTPNAVERIDSLSPLSKILLNAITVIQDNHVRGKSRLAEYVSRFDRLQLDWWPITVLVGLQLSSSMVESEGSRKV